MPNKHSNSGKDYIFLGGTGLWFPLFQAVSLTPDGGCDSRAAFRCALMILPDDTVSNISASSAVAHVHTLKSKEAFICLSGPPKPEKERKSSVFFHDHEQPTLTKPQNTNEGYPPAEPEWF